MVPIAYASSEGSDEPVHPRKIASALIAHIHNEGACRGCEFKISKAIEMIGTSRNSLYLPHVCRSMYPAKIRGGRYLLGPTLGPALLIVSAADKGTG